ncbi:hypothetical protein BDZ45DRAFT_723387 [Acephala macrosclerotiorum]|nr:hypothetical protein BDZ45DRAFT_723387 [Acephala macrosclerotiorum]
MRANVLPPQLAILAFAEHALSALTGKSINVGPLLTSGEDPMTLVSAYNAYASADCYVSSVLDYIHSGSLGVIEDPDDNLCTAGKTIQEEDPDSQYRLICCPSDAMLVGCTWEGAGAGSDDSICTGAGADFCGTGYFELIADGYIDQTGNVSCLLNKRSLYCATDPELELCSWTACGGSCDSGFYTSPNVSVYAGSNLNQDSELCDGGKSQFCCPSEDTYTGCACYGGDYCTSSCPSDKILITQRSEIENTTIEGSRLGLACQPTDLFTYPDTTHVSHEYAIEETSNDDATDDASKDPFAFVMVDRDTAAYSKSLVDQWSFLGDDSALSKRSIKKRDVFTKRNDAFHNVLETYSIQCLNLTGCEAIFEKEPRIPSSRCLWLWERDLKPGSSVSSLSDRLQYTNLLEYWDDIMDTPAQNRKRWFGAFSDWLTRVTTIVKQDTGYLPLEYDETIKLFYFSKTCPATGLTTTLDLDLNIHLGLGAQYVYYFEGSILPSPNLIASYGYFAVSPAAAANYTTDLDDSPRAILPGLSIKGLISIGPEFDLTGSMDASLKVSGVLNAGVSVAWAKAEVYFPQDSDGIAASIAPGTLDDSNDPYKQTYSIEPTFDASVTATGNLARKYWDYNVKQHLLIVL